MYFYPHEKSDHSLKPINTVWPSWAQSGKDHDAVRAYLHSRSLNPDLAEENGWYPTRDFSELRLVIPCQVKEPGHVYFQARALHDHGLRYRSPVGPRKGAFVAVLPIDLDVEAYGAEHEAVLVTEGPMDALAGGEFALSLALMGMSPDSATLDHIAAFLETHCRTRIVLVLDKEPEAQSNSIELLAQFSARGFHCQYVSPPEKDLAASTYAVRRRFVTPLLEELCRKQNRRRSSTSSLGTHRKR